MKRLIATATFVAVLAAAVAAIGASARTEATPDSSQTAERARLPSLPSNIRRRGRFLIGVKCDAPPFGYINVRGENAGFDVEIARWFSRYAFGRSNRVSFECTPTPAREPALTSGRVDMVIATFTYTRDRDTRIDFSRAYYKATGRLLVKNDQPNALLDQISSRNIVTTSGSIYDRWVRRCFPNAKLTVTDNFTNAALTFNQGRADTLMWDDSVLVGIAAADRTSKLTTDTFLALPYGIGIRQGNAPLVRWVNSRLELMRKADRFMALLRNNVPARFVAGFSNNILRPRNTFGYAPATAPAPDTVCP
jgi:polar amino acid transport system substrate-binding protein